MTDYGRGSGSEPWHPEDPLFGDMYDPGYDGRQQGQDYRERGRPQPPRQGDWQDPYATGPQQQYSHPQQAYPQPQYSQQQEPQQGQPHPQQQSYPQQGYPQQHPQQQQGYPQAGYDGWDTGAHQTGGYGHQDPYGGQSPQDPYGGQQPDFYGQNGYPPPPPPQPQYRQQPQGQGPQQGQPQGPGPQQQGPQQGQQPQPQRPQPPQQARPQEPAAEPLRTAPEETGEWQPDEEPDPREHAFFSDRDDDDDDDSPSTPNSGGRRAGKSGKGGKKRRSGCACLVVLLVLGGGLGGAGYFGYHFYESHFGPAPDYSGQGAGDVQVKIPQGASATTMGNILKDAGVVKSVGAFTSAASKNPKGRLIQPGVYALRENMSAAAAVTLMLDPKSQNAMIIPEGWRAIRIYQAIDTKLNLKAGTTAAEVKGAKLDLPSWAHGNIEGFLFPAKYSISKNMKPLDVVQQMVAQAKAEYTKDDLENTAKRLGKSPEDILKIASLVQAEAQEPDDFGKVSRVVYNRLDKDMTLGFDSTLNYAMGRSTLNTTNKDTQYASPYNTYLHKGLPPGPIDNPGHQALTAALAPTDGDWLYFVTVKPHDTRFTDNYTAHQKNVQAFNDYQREHGG